MKRFCCDVTLVDDHAARIVSTVQTIVGMQTGSDSFWRIFHCPECGRNWLQHHDHYTSSGYSHSWDAQRMPNDTDSDIRRLYNDAQTWRSQETDCHRPTEAELGRA